jgi:soluble lytic murein transglycosylase-like protein
MNLSAAQIQAYAAAAGFSGADLQTAVGIARAESSGNPSAYNPEGSYGLWQIYLPAHPEYAGVNLNDPQTNANAAFAIYSAAGGFSPWSTYISGAYLAYMPSLTLPATAATSTFAPSTSVLTLPAVNSAQNIASGSDLTTIGLALALALGVVFAFSEA